MSLKRNDFVKKLVLCSLFLQIVNGYPLSSTEKSVESEEKQFPNGTVIGKYAYLDKEGNPVQVKYYADDSSYGVELNSYKVVQHKDGLASTHIEKQIKKSDDSSSSIPTKGSYPEHAAKDGAFDFIGSFKYPPRPAQAAYKYDAPKPHSECNRDAFPKKSHQKYKYKSPDYEIYRKNNLDTTQPYGDNNEKVRVYNFDKEARKTRQIEKEENGQFCTF